MPIYDTPTTAKNNIIRDNAISETMKHQADGGAIYTLSMQPDSVVSGNYIKNTPGPAYGAIYHDEGSRYFTSTQNALCNVDARWLFLDHGMNIDAQRNFTTQPVSLTQANSTDSTIANNTVIPGCEQYGGARASTCPSPRTRRRTARSGTSSRPISSTWPCCSTTGG